jgi:hypothetical protein
MVKPLIFCFRSISSWDPLICFPGTTYCNGNDSRNIFRLHLLQNLYTENFLRLARMKFSLLMLIIANKFPRNRALVRSRIAICREKFPVKLMPPRFLFYLTEEFVHLLSFSCLPHSPQSCFFLTPPFFPPSSQKIMYSPGLYFLEI